MFDYLLSYIDKIKKDDPAAPSNFQIFLTYPGLHALMFHRFNHFLYNHKLKGLARFFAFVNRSLTNIEIHPGAKIAKGVMIDHGTGLVIGETAEVGEGCTLYHGATLGGTGNERGKRHPTIGKNVIVGTGCKILGNIKIGNNCKIAANAVVLQDIPDNSTVVGIPGRVVKQNGKKVRENCNQDLLIKSIQEKLEELESLKSEIQVLKDKINS